MKKANNKHANTMKNTNKTKTLQHSQARSIEPINESVIEILHNQLNATS